MPIDVVNEAIRQERKGIERGTDRKKMSKKGGKKKEHLTMKGKKKKKKEAIKFKRGKGSRREVIMCRKRENDGGHPVDSALKADLFSACCSTWLSITFFSFHFGKPCCCELMKNSSKEWNGNVERERVVRGR